MSHSYSYGAINVNEGVSKPRTFSGNASTWKWGFDYDFEFGVGWYKISRADIAIQNAL